MKGAAFLGDLRCRGVQLRLEANGLRYRAPKGVLTDVDRAALREHRDALLMLLRSEAEASSPPLDPCLNCNMGDWFWQPNWPVPGTGRWLCQTCCARPSPSLVEVAAGLTADERRQLEAEAAAGGVARVVIDLLAGADTTIPPGLATDAAATIAAALRDAGWIVVYSARLNAEVIFSRDADVAIPDEHAALPRFDQAELAVLAAEQPSADRLRAIVDVKREMPGTREVGDSGERLTPARDVFAPPRTKGGRRS